MKVFYPGALLVLSLLVGGCVVAIGNKGDCAKDGGHHGGQMGRCSATVAEIDAISKLHTDSAKSERFEAVAGREGLKPAEQVHLINAVYKKLFTDSSKERVLLRLIGNPNFSHAGKEAILIQLDKFSTDSAKLAILRAIGERGTLMEDIEETEEDVEVEGETE